MPRRARPGAAPRGDDGIHLGEKNGVGCFQYWFDGRLLIDWTRLVRREVLSNVE